MHLATMAYAVGGNKQSHEIVLSPDAILQSYWVEVIRWDTEINGIADFFDNYPTKCG
jgi:hypothetical protein